MANFTKPDTEGLIEIALGAITLVAGVLLIVFQFWKPWKK